MTLAYTQRLQQTLDSIKNYKNKASPRKCASSLPTLRPLHRPIYLQFYAVPPGFPGHVLGKSPLPFDLTSVKSWWCEWSQCHRSTTTGAYPETSALFFFVFFFFLSWKVLNYDSVSNNLTLRSLKHGSDLQECSLCAFWTGEEQRIVLQPEAGTAAPNLFFLSFVLRKSGKRKDNMNRQICKDQLLHCKLGSSIHIYDFLALNCKFKVCRYSIIY